MSFYLPNTTWKQVGTGVGAVTVKAFGAVRVYFGATPSFAGSIVLAYDTRRGPYTLNGAGAAMWVQSDDIGPPGTDGHRNALWVSGTGTFITNDSLPRPVFPSGLALPSRYDFNTANPMYITHYADGLRGPDYTIDSFQDSFDRGLRVMDSDVHLTSDGGPALIHDGTVDELTTSTGSVASFTTAQFKALVVDYPYNIFGFAAGNAITLDDKISLLGNTVVYVPEAKNASAVGVIISSLQSGGIHTDRAIIQSFRLGDLAEIVASGYGACYLTNSGTENIQAVIDSGAEYVGINSTASDAVFQQWVASGLKVLTWTVSRRIRRDELLALGVMGFFSDDAGYLGSTNTVKSTSFEDNKWLAGMLSEQEPRDTRGSDADRSAETRGVIYADGAFGWNSDTSETLYTLQGYLTDDTESSDDTWTLDFTFEPVAGVEWAAVGFQRASDKDIRYIDGNSAGTFGYNFLFRTDGRLQIYRRDGGGASQISITNGTALTLGVKYRHRIIVTPTTLTLQRLSTGGAVVHEVSAADSNYRSKYIHFGRRRLGCKFSDISIT